MVGATPRHRAGNEPGQYLTEFHRTNVPGKRITAAYVNDHIAAESRDRIETQEKTLHLLDELAQAQQRLESTIAQAVREARNEGEAEAMAIFSRMQQQAIHQGTRLASEVERIKGSAESTDPVLQQAALRDAAVLKERTDTRIDDTDASLASQLGTLRGEVQTIRETEIPRLAGRVAMVENGQGSLNQRLSLLERFGPILRHFPVIGWVVAAVAALVMLLFVWIAGALANIDGFLLFVSVVAAFLGTFAIVVGLFALTSDRGNQPVPVETEVVTTDDDLDRTFRPADYPYDTKVEEQTRVTHDPVTDRTTAAHKATTVRR